MEPEIMIGIEELNCLVEIYRNVIDEDLCKRLYNTVKEDCITKYDISYFDRTTKQMSTIQQPRTNCVYADENVTNMSYTTVKIPTLPWNNSITELKETISFEDFKPNSCLVNGYLSLNDHVGLHQDKELRDENNIVCTVSLGGSRCFKFVPFFGNLTNKEQKLLDKYLEENDELSTYETYLNEGDVVYMYANTNRYFKHQILKYRKTKDPYSFKPRYSCTFRVIDTD